MRRIDVHKDFIFYRGDTINFEAIRRAILNEIEVRGYPVCHRCNYILNSQDGNCPQCNRHQEAYEELAERIKNEIAKWDGEKIERFCEKEFEWDMKYKGDSIFTVNDSEEYPEGLHKDELLEQIRRTSIGYEYKDLEDLLERVKRE